MCFAALGIIGPILSAVGSIVGAMASASAAQQQANAQAQQAAYQAAVARNNATAEAYKASEKSQDVAIKGEYALAKQRAAFASGGVAVDTGTPVTVFGISSGRIAGDVAAEQYAGQLETKRWQDQAGLYDLQAANARAAGNTAAQGAIIGGVFSGAAGLARAGAGQSLSAFG